MTHTTFTVKGAFKEARGIMRPKLRKVVGQYAAIVAMFMLLSMLSDSNMLLGILVSSVFAFVTALFSLGYAKRGSYSFEELMKAFSFQAFAYFFLAYLVSRLFIVAGVFLLVIPGIMLAVWLCLVKFIAAEREIGPWDACKKSARLTRGNRWKLLWFFVVAGLFNLLGLLCLIVGVFYTLPVTLIASAVIYRKLSEAEAVEPEIVKAPETEAIEIPSAEVVQ